MPSDGASPFLTKREVAEHLRVSVRTVERVIERGELTTIPVGTGRGSARIRREDLEAYLSNRGAAA